MKKLITLFVILAALAVGGKSYAQQTIAVQSGNASTFYANLDTAITYAPANSTVYIPSGTFSINVKINKCLKIYGVGHYPTNSATLDQGRTIISGDITLLTGADNGLLSGV